MRGFADRVTRVAPSATIAISNRAAKLEADGVDVVNLSVGEPDFPTPDNVVRAAKESLDAGDHGYTTSNGIPELRAAISESFAADGLAYAPDEIIVTPGAKQALFEVFMTLVDARDEVILLDPAWVSYESIVKLAGGALDRVDLAPHDFHLEPALSELANAISDRTRLLVINSPNNPSGAVYSRAALEGVRDLAVDHDLTVVTDEIYKAITYRGEYTSLGTLEGMADRTITINGFSKAYAMTGWRLGYVGAPEAIIDEAGKLHSHSVSCAANFVQHAGVEALRNTAEPVREMVAAFKTRRDRVIDLLTDHGVDVPVPDGAFYLMLPVDADDTHWCERAINEAHVATVPGTAFGAPGYARLSYAAGQNRLEAGIDRLVDAGLI